MSGARTAARPVCLLAMLAVAWAAGAAVDEFERAMETLRGGDEEAARSHLQRLAGAHDARAQDVLAAMLQKGVGGPRSLVDAMGWYCLLAHHPQGGRATVNALWRLAEFHRTGGGQPGADYQRGERSEENPVKAMFWYQVLAHQERYYEQVLPEGERLGRIGAGIVERQLLAPERAALARTLESWSPLARPPSAQACLALP